MSRFFVVSALHLRNRAAGSSARRHMTPPVCGGADCRTKYCGSALRTVCCRVGAAGSRGADCRTKYRGFALCTVCCRVGAAGSRGNCKPAVRVSAAIGFHREIGNGVSGVNIYLASPFFNETERKNHDAALAILREKGLEVYAPLLHQRGRESVSRKTWAEATFRDDAAAIRRCDVLVLLFYGLYSDSGTAWECGYGYALGKRIVAVHLHEGKSNCMVNCSCHANVRGAGWTARVRFLCASADKLLRVKWAAGMRFAAYAAEGGSMCRAVP
mgnify:CR=1 FL=1